MNKKVYFWIDELTHHKVSLDSQKKKSLKAKKKCWKQIKSILFPLVALRPFYAQQWKLINKSFSKPVFKIISLKLETFFFCLTQNHSIYSNSKRNLHNFDQISCVLWCYYFFTLNTIFKQNQISVLCKYFKVKWTIITR